jgi:hypothetical protein
VEFADRPRRANPPNHKRLNMKQQPSAKRDPSAAMIAGNPAIDP